MPSPNSAGISAAARWITALSYKNYFDDFSFNVAPVPEPGSVLVVVLGSLMPIRRRKSAVK
jgi:hypothetical protein